MPYSVLIMGPLILIGMTPLCLGGILSVDLKVPIVALCNHKSMCRPEIYHLFVYSNFFPYPKHKIMRISFEYQCQKWVLFLAVGCKL